jgi:hypothetical protein
VQSVDKAFDDVALPRVAVQRVIQPEERNTHENRTNAVKRL